jgi:hypothetical protein
VESLYHNSYIRVGGITNALLKWAIRKAEIACKESGEAVSDHLLHMQEMIPGGKGARRPYSKNLYS